MLFKCTNEGCEALLETSKPGIIRNSELHAKTKVSVNKKGVGHCHEAIRSSAGLVVGGISCCSNNAQNTRSNPGEEKPWLYLVT